MERAFGRPKVLRALTSLDAGEFARLLELFEAQHAVNRQRRTWERREAATLARSGQPGGVAHQPRQAPVHPLLFQGLPAPRSGRFTSGMSQPQVSVWVGQLTPVINAALGRQLHLPARRPADLEHLLAEVPELRLLIVDGTERPVRRAKDDKKQRKHYSGKKEGAPQKEPAGHRRAAGGLSWTHGTGQHARQGSSPTGLSCASRRMRCSSRTRVCRATNRRSAPRSSPRKSRGAGPCVPTKRPSTRSSAAPVSWSSTPSPGGSVAASSPTPSAAGAKGLVDEVMLAACGLHNLRESGRAAC